MWDQSKGGGRLNNEPGWQNEEVFYQIYPLGFCGAPFENDGQTVNRISKVKDWIPHLQRLNVGAVYFSPVFESDTHGYDTRDYRKIDCRLGGNSDFREVCAALHGAGIRVVLDGVFNHVGRGFWAFQDVLKNRESSPYKDWFLINFGGNSNYNDGLWYEGWEGHFELVKLNLQNPAVVDHLLSCVEFWMEEFGIDGLRLDVAYLLDENFLRRLHGFCREKDPAFFLLGEMIHGDYNRIMNPEMLDSVTNYECYKGLYSAFNSLNMFEIAHSLARQFGPENWTLYRGKHLFSFADNHDVTRIHSILTDKERLKALYAVLFCMPGIPCLYYGSEWGADGEKKDGDPALRPCFEAPVENELTEFVGRLAAAKRECKALWYGDFQNVTLQNKQWIMGRQCPEQTVLMAVNADGAEADIACPYGGRAVELLTGEEVELRGSVHLSPYGVKIFVLGERPPLRREEPVFQPEPAEAPAEVPAEGSQNRGGLDAVRVVDHDSCWAEQFREEADRLKAAMGDNALRLFHIGSTSVPGLKAKPVLDLLCVVRDLERVDAQAEALGTLGYTLLGECGVPGRRYLRKGETERTHHLHCYRFDDLGNIVKDLAFPAYLRAHPDVGDAYGELKTRLALEYAEDYLGYCRAKEDFVSQTARDALIWYWETYRE